MVSNLLKKRAKSEAVKQYGFGVELPWLPLFLAFLLGVFSTQGFAQSNSQECAVAAQTLVDAHNEYERYCTQQRKDCDPIDGQWYCSSSSINQSRVPNVVNLGNNQSSNPSSSSNSSQEQQTDSQADSSATDGQGPCLDPDGDGWGWNGSSCRVSSDPTSSTTNTTTSSSSSSSSNSGECIDPDGDGWGWNGASCRVASGAQSNTGSSQGSGSSSGSGSYRPADITDLVLLTGQSNALGANTDYDASLDSPHKQVFAFTNTGWKRADLRQIWDRGWHPRNYPDTDPSNNLLLHFGKRLVSRDSDRVVGFILVSAPGAAISNWDYNDEFYQRIDARVIDAINQLPHKSQLDGVLWHQGETDANDTPYYENKLRALIRNFRSENWFSSGKPFLCGEIARRGGVNNRLNSLNSDSDAYTGCVSANGLPTRVDGSHFTAEGLREIGKRYADRYYSMTR